MKKAIIWVIVFLISFNYAYATHEIRLTFDGTGNLSNLGANDEVVDGMFHQKAGVIRSTGTMARWILNWSRELSLPETGCKNVTYNYQINVTGGNGDYHNFLSYRNGSGSGMADPYDTRGGSTTHDIFDGVSQVRLSDRGFHFNNVTIFFNCTGDGGGSNNQGYNRFLNGTFLGNSSDRKSSHFPDFLLFAMDNPSGGWYDNISVCNATSGKPDFGCVAHPIVEPNTTPPNITTYNMTSEGGAGCTNWNTSKSNPCSTSDVTPTVNITTDESAWCAIGTQDINFTRYDELSTNRSCIGQSTQSHICTLALEDELVYDNSSIYISCRDSSNNTNANSTSGALALTITGLEAAGRNSIGIGIQNALLSGYTNYTDLQIYARNISNAQVSGTFDRAAKKGTKMWAFNGIGVSDSHVNMFNLTPVLYNLEFANATSQNLTNMTQALIEATK